MSDVVSNWIFARSWHEKHLAEGGEIFPTFSSLGWFMRTHLMELVKAGVYRPGVGQRGAMVHREKFARVVDEILDRQAQQSLARSNAA